MWEILGRFCLSVTMMYQVKYNVSRLSLFCLQKKGVVNTCTSVIKSSTEDRNRVKHMDKMELADNLHFGLSRVLLKVF